MKEGGEHVEGSESAKNQLAVKVKSKHVTLTHFTFPAGERRSAAKILIGLVVVVRRFTISQFATHIL